MPDPHHLADILDAAPRHGYAPDRDRPSEAKKPMALDATGRENRHDRYVRLSDALAREIAAALRGISNRADPRGVPVNHR